MPKTWDDMAATAKMVQDKEREAGNSDMWGFVFQGNAYEGLTCNALEWVKSNRAAARSSKPDGTISINNPKAAAAIERAKGWVGTISPPGRTCLRRRRSSRRLADRQCRLHAQLALRLFARQWRRLRHKG